MTSGTWQQSISGSSIPDKLIDGWLGLALDSTSTTTKNYNILTAL